MLFLNKADCIANFLKTLMTHKKMHSVLEDTVWGPPPEYKSRTVLTQVCYYISTIVAEYTGKSWYPQRRTNKYPPLPLITPCSNSGINVVPGY